MPLEGQQLLPREIVKLLWDGGWRDADNIMIMAAITQAESALFTEAWNYNPPTRSLPKGSYDWGLYQLNDGGVTGADQEAFKAIAFNPPLATKQARKLYEARHFQPWVAYANKSYEKFIPQASKGLANMLRLKHDIKVLIP
jgi:hypothetical protein